MKSTATNTEVLDALRAHVAGETEYAIRTDWTLYNAIGRRVGIAAIETRDRATRDRFTAQVRRQLFHLVDDGTMIRVPQPDRGADYYTPWAHEVMLRRQQTPDPGEQEYERAMAVVRARRDTRHVRYHPAAHMAGLRELRYVTEGAAVVLRHDGSVDAYGDVTVIDQVHGDDAR
jgi:hypothetical protein